MTRLHTALHRKIMGEMESKRCRADCSVTDVAPRTKGHMHATPSLDFLVVHKGSITLHLEGGVKANIKEGEAIGE
jgi:hypothetical protein